MQDDGNVSQGVKNGAFNCVQAVVSKGMDYPMKIQIVEMLGFLQIVEHFKLQNTTLDIDQIDDENYRDEEEFY